MNIIFFSNSCWSVINFRKNLIKNFKKNFKIIIIAPFDGYEKELKKFGCEVYNIKINNNKISLLHDIFLLFQIYKILYQLKHNSILLNFTIKPLIYGTLVSRILMIPTICMITGLGTVFIDKSFITNIVLILYKISFKNVSHVFFQNKDDKKIFIDRKVISKKNYSLIPGSGIDLKKFRYKKIIKKKFTNFLLVTRIIKEKGILEYIKAAKLIKKKKFKIKFNLAGSFVEDNPSSLSKKIIFQAHKENIINYKGFVKDIRSEIKKADCMVLPSYREGTPRSLLEGAAMGRPIITTDVTGCRETVLGGISGYLFKPKNYKSLYLSILKFHKLPASIKSKMAKKSYELVKTFFDEKIVIKAYEEVILKILKKQIIK
jgi:glycosyltransferase involved in cell wall biosynthesis